MRIWYDEQIFLAQRLGGISRYFAELIRCLRLDESLEVEPALTFRFARNQHLAERAPGTAHRVRPGGHFDSARRCTLANTLLPRRGPGPGAVVHLTYYSVDAILRFAGQRRISTVYDMIPELIDGASSDLAKAKRQVLMSSRCVLAISEATRNELLRWTDLDPSTVITVPLGVDPLPESECLASVRRRQVLFVGKRGGYKRFDVLLAALQLLPEIEVELLCVGGGRFLPSELQSIAELPRHVCVRQQDLAQADLTREYLTSALLVSTSDYEGFGLGNVEAMAAGCPTVLSDIPVYREVAGNAARYFPPGDPGGLAEVLEKALAGTAEEMSVWQRRGLMRVAEYSWSATAAQTAAVYHAVAEA